MQNLLIIEKLYWVTKMLKDKDRIFQNLYNDSGADIESAKLRNDWNGTREILEKGREWIINEVKSSELRGRGGAGFPTSILVLSYSHDR